MYTFFSDQQKHANKADTQQGTGGDAGQALPHKLSQ